MLVGAVLICVSVVTCSASISLPKTKAMPWLTAVSIVGFLAGLGSYVIGRVAIWWRET